MFSKKALAANPKLAEQIIKAHAEAIKRFYEDKAFAVKAYLAFDKQPEADVSRIYDIYSKGQDLRARPVRPRPGRQIDCQPAGRSRVWPRDLKAFDFKQVVDNSTVDRLVKEGFFEKLFGPRHQDRGAAASEDRVR